MTELNELVAVSVPGLHPADDPHCPFCPVEEKDEPWTTYGGEKNDSSILREVLLDPKRLGAKQPGVRPKSGVRARQKDDAAAPIPQSPKGDHGPYSFEAHHLISGKHALRDHPMEQWILEKPGSITANTGYSVNNAANGVWLPSVPLKWVAGGFGPLSDVEKYAIACVVMNAGLGQFHKGSHDIVDSDDPAQKHHGSYNEWLKSRMTEVSNRIGDWSLHCTISKQRKDAGQKLRPSIRVHDVLDAVAVTMRSMVTGEPRRWFVFVSKLALWYHKELTEEPLPFVPKHQKQRR